MKKSRAIALAAVSVGTLALTSQAMAGDIWWSSMGQGGPNAGNPVGTVNADGSGLNQNAFSIAGMGASIGAATLDHAYYRSGTAIARVKLDGTGIESTFIPSAFVGAGAAKMLIEGTTLYWITGSDGSYTIGKANLDGTGAVANYVTGQQSTPARCGGPNFAISAGYAFIRFAAGTPMGQGSCQLANPSTGGVDRVSLTTKAVDSNYYSGAFGDDGLAGNATYVFGLQGTGQQTPTDDIYRANPTGAVDNSAWQAGPNGTLSATAGKIAATDSKIVMIDGMGPSPKVKTVSATQSGAGVSEVATLTAMGSMIQGLVTQAPVHSGSGSTPAPTADPVPAAASTAPVAAAALRAPTQSPTANADGNVAVTIALQLDEVGKYTFIFERVTSNEMSLEHASSSRIPMQKGSKIGKRKLTKNVTAANLTTTTAGAKLVMRALLKKAQAKSWNLRVIHTATDGSQTESYIAK